MALFPPETNAPLIVDANAVLTQSLSLESFQVVSGRLPKVAQGYRPMQIQKLSPGRPLNVSKPVYQGVMK